MRRSSGGRSMPRAASNNTAPLMRIDPRSGLAIPAIALTTLVFPDPDGPKSPTIGASTENLTASSNAPSRCSMSMSIIALRPRGAASEPFGCRQRDDRQNDGDDAQPQRLGVAAGNLGERINRQRQGLGLAGDVRNKS